MTKLSQDELIKKYPDYKKYPKYNGVYTSRLKKVLSEDNFSGVLQIQKIVWKKGERVVFSENDQIISDSVSTSASLNTLLEKNKKDILSLIKQKPTLSLEDRKQKKEKNLSNDKLKPTIDALKKVDKSLNNEYIIRENQDFDSLFQKLPDFWKEHMFMKKKVYVWVVSSVDNKKIKVCIWKHDKNPIYFDVNIFDIFGKRKYLKWDKVFLDSRKKPLTLASQKEFNRQRLADLRRLGIYLNSKKPIIYKTQSWKVIKGHVVWLSQDVLSKEVIFQPLRGNSFSLSFDSLQKWLIKKQKRDNKKKLSDHVKEQEAA